MRTTTQLEALSITGHLREIGVNAHADEGKRGHWRVVVTARDGDRSWIFMVQGLTWKALELRGEKPYGTIDVGVSIDTSNMRAISFGIMKTLARCLANYEILTEPEPHEAATVLPWHEARKELTDG